VGAQDYRRNRQIRVPDVRLIDEKGEQVGVVNTREALRMAEEAGLDLVEVSPTARPPVCKILDFGKFKYDARKRDQKTGVKKTSSQLKELRVRPAIDKHDLSYRLEQGKKFLAAGHKVQVVCIFRGRQMRHPEHGYNVMKEVTDQLIDVARVESPAKMMGRRMTMLLSPLPTKPGAKSGGAPAEKPTEPKPERKLTPVDPPKAAAPVEASESSESSGS
jgi:translation initiation factor IF-3